MKVFFAVLSLLASLLLPLTPARGYEMPPSQIYHPQPANDLSAQVARLEQTVAALQQQIALLQSVIKIYGSTVEIGSGHDLKIKAAGTVDIRSGLNTVIKSSTGISIQSSGTGEIQASALSLKGDILRLNRATRPIATVGSVIGGNQVLTGSATIFGE